VYQYFYYKKIISLCGCFFCFLLVIVVSAFLFKKNSEFVGVVSLLESCMYLKSFPLQENDQAAVPSSFRVGKY
jgi:hypothetical protein